MAQTLRKTLPSEQGNNAVSLKCNKRNLAVTLSCPQIDKLWNDSYILNALDSMAAL
jgi:hypothetical protein